MRQKLQMRVCHLYPDLLQLYGDRGNVLALKRRSEARGINFVVEHISRGDVFDPSRYHLVFLGGGQDAEQALIYKDLVEKKGDAIRDAVDCGKVFLCICGGYQLMGQSYTDEKGHTIEGVGALNVHTVAKSTRFIGDTIYKSALFSNCPILYGFENHSGRTYLGEGVRPLAKVIKGAGNNGEDQTEGALYKSVVATYSHGSFLPKNPQMTDYLIRLSLFDQMPQDADLPYLGTEIEDFARRRLPSCKNA